MLGFPLDFWDYATFAVLFVLGAAALTAAVLLLGLPGRIAGSPALDDFRNWLIREAA